MPFGEENVDATVLGDLVRHVFGSDTKLRNWRFLGGGTSNVAFQVNVNNDPRSFVFRFSRGLHDDVYETEAANYTTVASATGVRVPEIIMIDRRHALVPTAYMVLEHLAGQEHASLCHPDNTAVAPEQKEHIRSQLGHFYARLHRATRPAQPGESVSLILLGISLFHTAVAAGYLTVDLDTVAACERAVRQDQALAAPTLAFCLPDGEIYFQQRDGTYHLSFVCDLEWSGYDHHLADLTRQAIPGRSLVDLDHPVELDVDSLRRDPFFIGYERSGGTADYEAVDRLALYTQLSTWGFVAGEAADPGKKQWIRDSRLPLINRLLQQVASRAA
ncbi:phosphotransferase family protein [Flindersiella endophytica]